MFHVREATSPTAEYKVLDAIHLLAGVVVFMAGQHQIDPIFLEEWNPILSYLCLVAARIGVIRRSVHENDLPGAFVVGSLL